VTFNKSTIENAARERFGEPGHTVAHVPHLAPGELAAEALKRDQHQSRTLATLRDTLLPNLLSGELSVAATDKEIFVSSKHIKRTMNP
jgi:hypothetical protein